MMRTRSWTGMFLAAATLLAVAPAAVPAAERPGYETYVVRHGDTLSGIAGRVFGDARRWREILKENPQVTNANRIYPGDTLEIPVPLSADTRGVVGLPAAGLEAREVAGAAEQDAAARAAAAAAERAAAAAADAAARAAADAAAAAVAATAAPDPSLQQARPVARINREQYRSAGYIADGLPAIAIVATVDERIMIATGDVAIANVSAVAGTRYTVVRAERRVYHPQTGLPLGWLVRRLGTAEVTCGGEANSTIVLIGMRDTAGVGDYLVPFDPNDVLEEDVLPHKAQPECFPAGPEDAVIVAFDEDRLMAGDHEFAYIDLGTSACVEPGMRFVVYRDQGRGGYMMVGELQVLRAGEDTSTALITTSMREIQIGDLLRAR